MLRAKGLGRNYELTLSWSTNFVLFFTHPELSAWPAGILDCFITFFLLIQRKVQLQVTRLRNGESTLVSSQDQYNLNAQIAITFAITIWNRPQTRADDQWAI